jgi:hypothetical protein
MSNFLRTYRFCIYRYWYLIYLYWYRYRKTDMSIKNWTYWHDLISTGIVKTDMSIENWTYWHVFIGTGKDKTNIDINLRGRGGRAV